jgi:hypothetical protein
MKLSQQIILLAIATTQSCQGFSSVSRPLQQRTPTFLKSSSTTDSAFSAFADSLEEEPEESPEKPWQAKLEDLLDPKTNLAERQILLSELLSANDEIRESVLDAMASRKVGRNLYVCTVLALRCKSDSTHYLLSWL